MRDLVKRIGRRLQEPVAASGVSAMGRSFPDVTFVDAFSRGDTQWRLDAIYSRFLAANPLKPSGTAIDIGAGVGGFAIPFAAAHPGWTVWCFEPAPNALKRLEANVGAAGLSNIHVLPVAVGPADDGVGPTEPSVLAIRALARPRRYVQEGREPTFLRPADENGARLGRGKDLPEVPANVLGALAPDLVKLTAPHSERPILAALARIKRQIAITGEAWGYVPATETLAASKGASVLFPLAGTPFGLCRSSGASGGRPGLDIVVAMYNAKGFVAECVDSLLASGGSGALGTDDIRVIIVDDGSTDGSGALVTKRYGNNPRVRLVGKPNGGCASARNFGRIHSDATHIAFVDADDSVDPGMFAGLLDAGRQTGAEIVQSGFRLHHAKGDGGPDHFEMPAGTYDNGGAIPEPLGGLKLSRISAQHLMRGQPTIWRRVYRRDFLDNRRIVFPEHIRAFDDQFFQLLTLQHVGDVVHVDGPGYRYRQHPAQDIRQGDERGFYSLEMYRAALRRGLQEGWPDFHGFLVSYVHTINWTWTGLRADLQGAFADGAAEFMVMFEKALGAEALAASALPQLTIPGFDSLLEGHRTRFADLPASYGFAYLDSMRMHPNLVRGIAARSREAGFL